jgi:hypothetical protein
MGLPISPIRISAYKMSLPDDQPPSLLGKGAALPASNSSPNKKHDDRPKGRTNEASTLSCFIPAKSLAQIGGDECANNAQNCGQDKPARLIVTGSDELRQHACDKADQDRP